MRIELTSSATAQIPETKKRRTEIIRTTITSFDEVLKNAESKQAGVAVVAVEEGENTTITAPPVKKADGTAEKKGASVTPLSSSDMSKTDYDLYFEKASRKYGVPVSLLKAMVKMESDFQPNETSSTGAAGLMQLMPETAKYLGVTDVYDPEQNIMGGARYISEKLKAYDGNLELALSAYNAGSGTVQKYGNTVPPQCRAYVAKILSYKEAYETAMAVG